MSENGEPVCKKRKTSSSPCCPDTAWGKLIEMEKEPTKGEDITVSDKKIPAYFISSTVDSKKGIVVFPDIWGITNRVRVIADTFSAEGYNVLVIDCYHGDTIGKTPDLMGFLGKYPYSKISDEIQAAIGFLVSKDVDKAYISALGFCWGGWAIAKSASEGVEWKCAVSLHPSTKIEAFIFKRDEAEMLGKCKMPFFLMPAGDDADLIKPGSYVVTKLEENGGKSIPFPEMKHGWASRGDDSVKDDIEKAFKLATEFFDEKTA